MHFYMHAVINTGCFRRYGAVEILVKLVILTNVTVFYHLVLNTNYGNYVDICLFKHLCYVRFYIGLVMVMLAMTQWEGTLQKV